MAKITKSKLTEHFKSIGMSEGFLSKFFAKLKKSGKEKEYEKLTKIEKDTTELRGRGNFHYRCELSGPALLFVS